MRSLVVVFLSACILFSLAGSGQLWATNLKQNLHNNDEPAPKKPQTVCPVMGGPVDKGLYVDVKGKRIYLCCAACEEAVRVEPEKYIKKIEDRGEAIDETPKTE